MVTRKLPGVTRSSFGRLLIWQVLSEMRADNDLQSIPVVIFSTSSHPAERKRAYACGAQYFLMKPATFAGLVAEIESAYRRFAGGHSTQARPEARGG